MKNAAILMVFSFFLVIGCAPHIQKPSDQKMRKFDEGVTTLSEADGIKEVKACSLYTHDEGTSSAKQRVVQKAINEVAPTFGIIVKGKNSIIVNCFKENQENKEIEHCLEQATLENEQTIIENAYTIQQVKYPILDDERVCVAVIVKWFVLETVANKPNISQYLINYKQKMKLSRSKPRHFLQSKKDTI